MRQGYSDRLVQWTLVALCVGGVLMFTPLAAIGTVILMGIAVVLIAMLFEIGVAYLRHMTTAFQASWLAYDYKPMREETTGRVPATDPIGQALGVTHYEIPSRWSNPVPSPFPARVTADEVVWHEHDDIYPSFYWNVRDGVGYSHKTQEPCTARQIVAALFMYGEFTSSAVDAMWAQVDAYPTYIDEDEVVDYD